MLDEVVERDGTVWKRITAGEVVSGRLQQQNVLKEIPGPTSFAKRCIEDDSVLIAFFLLIDPQMLRHIQTCKR